MSKPIDLKRLQAQAAPHFSDWMRAGAEQEVRSAKMARAEIKKIASLSIHTLRESFDVGGLYLFANADINDDNFKEIFYIGLAKKQSLAIRVRDYLIKEISVLDPSLMDKDEISARKDICQRIHAAMPLSPNVSSYVEKHMKSRLMSRANIIFLSPQSAPLPYIEAAETLLIRGAIECGAPLVNQKKIKASVEAALVGKELAFSALRKWRKEGLGNQISDKWEEVIERICLA